MGKKYKHADEEQGKNMVSEPAFTYQAKSHTSELPVETIELLEIQAEQAIKEFENDLCVPHEKIKRK